MACSSSMDVAKISTSRTKSTETTNINILNPHDLMQRLQEATKNNNLFASMKETIILNHDFSRGLEEVELQELIHDTKEPSVRSMLQHLLNLCEGEDMLLAATEEGENLTRYSWVVKGERMKNGKFDVLVVRASQAKQVDKTKLMVIGLVSSSLGCVVGSVVGSVVNPAAGVIAGGMVLGAASLKAVFDFQKSSPDLIYGYIIKNLYDQNLLNISNTNTSSQE